MSETTQPDAAETTETNDDEHQDDGKPFDREYVEKLRKESQGYRERAKTAESRVAELDDAQTRADGYARELFTARVTATGRLADPTDLPFNAELLDSPDALGQAVTDLLAAKPHLASRKPAWGDVGAGQRKDNHGPVDLFARARERM